MSGGQSHPAAHQAAEKLRELLPQAIDGTTIVFEVIDYPEEGNIIQIIILPLSQMNKGPLPGQEAAPEPPKL